MFMPRAIGPIRPPPEAHSLLIRVTENCPWNRCKFCSVFKEKRFKKRTVAEVQKDILAAKREADHIMEWAEHTKHPINLVARHNNILWLDDGYVSRAFLQDSNSLVMKIELLVEILEFLYETFPTLKRVSSYARAKTVVRKKPDQLRQLRKAGLSRLYIGIESGDEELLAYMQKGATADEMVQAGQKVMKAGFELSLYVMPGLGGRERWEHHAKNTARVLNEINPHFIRLRTLHLMEGTPLYEQAKRDEFHVSTIEEVLIEVRRLIEDLNVTSELIITDQAFNAFMGAYDGKLPEDKEGLLKSIDKALTWWRKKGKSKRNPFLGNLNQSVN